MIGYTSFLQKFNISPTAAKVYISLLELGKSSADKIAKRAETYKANTYDALEKLAQIGLASYVFEENKKLFIATNPEKLPIIVEDMQEKQSLRIEELKKEMKELMPQLKAKYESVKERELFEIYRGRKAYKAIINEILKERPNCWKGFGNLQIQALFPIDFKRWFKNIPIRLFSTKSEDVIKRAAAAKETTNVDIIWLPKEVYMPIVWVIFGKNVLIITYEPDIILIRIKSEQVVETFSNQFDYLWRKYSK